MTLEEERLQRIADRRLRREAAVAGHYERLAAAINRQRPTANAVHRIRETVVEQLVYATPKNVTHRRHVLTIFGAEVQQYVKIMQTYKTDYDPETREHLYTRLAVLVLPRYERLGPTTYAHPAERHVVELHTGEFNYEKAAEHALGWFDDRQRNIVDGEWGEVNRVMAEAVGPKLKGKHVTEVTPSFNGRGKVRVVLKPLHLNAEQVVKLEALLRSL